MKKDNLTELEFVVFQGRLKDKNNGLAKGRFDLKTIEGVEERQVFVRQKKLQCTWVKFLDGRDKTFNLPYADFNALREKEIA